jgi:glycosyltransferase involved in cell wall biosynthesis
MHFAVSSTTLFSARRKNIPVVATNHFMPENLIHYLPFPHWLKKTIISLAWKDAARIYRKTDVVISPTETAKKVLDKWLGNTNTKSIVLSNGVALDHFHPDHQTKQVVEKYHLPNLPLLLFVGRLDKEKNIDVILRAFARSAKNFHIVIAGSGSEKKHLDELAASLNIKEHVTFTGFVPNEELPALYAASSGFINAGVAELQGMSVMEAMASGLPVLGARAVALPELVHHGENGYLFEPGNREELAGYMTTLFANEEKRKQMGEKSMEIIQPHRFSNVVIKCEEIYGQLIHV